MKKYYRVLVNYVDKNMKEKLVQKILYTNSKEEDERFKAEMNGESEVVYEFDVLFEDPIPGYMINKILEEYTYFPNLFGIFKYHFHLYSSDLILIKNKTKDETYTVLKSKELELGTVINKETYNSLIISANLPIVLLSDSVYRQLELENSSNKKMYKLIGKFEEDDNGIERENLGNMIKELGIIGSLSADVGNIELFYGDEQHPGVYAIAHDSANYYGEMYTDKK